MAKKNDSVMKVGFDPGFGWIKCTLASQCTPVILPSVVGVGYINGSLDLAGLASIDSVELPYQLQWDGLDYLVGPNVAHHTRPIARQDFSRFIDGPELLVLAYTALAQLNVSGSQVAMVIGLPVEVLQNKSLAKEIFTALQARLVGQHRFTLNDKEVAFEIVKIRADVAQPLGAWLDWGLSDDGKWTRGAEARRQPTLIIDQGFNTIDVFGIEDSKPSPRYIAGDTLGMRRASESIASTIRHRHQRQLSLHECDSLARRYLAGDDVSIYVHGQPVDVTNIVRQSLDSLAAQVSQFLNSILDDPDRFQIILTGGGAISLHGRLTQTYKHASMAAAPSVANARGLAKLANSSFI